MTSICGKLQEHLYTVKLTGIPGNEQDSNNQRLTVLQEQHNTDKNNAYVAIFLDANLNTIRVTRANSPYLDNIADEQEDSLIFMTQPEFEQFKQKCSNQFKSIYAFSWGSAAIVSALVSGLMWKLLSTLAVFAITAAAPYVWFLPLILAVTAFVLYLIITLIKVYCNTGTLNPKDAVNLLCNATVFALQVLVGVFFWILAEFIVVNCAIPLGFAALLVGVFEAIGVSIVAMAAFVKVYKEQNASFETARLAAMTAFLGASWMLVDLVKLVAVATVMITSIIFFTVNAVYVNNSAPVCSPRKWHWPFGKKQVELDMTMAPDNAPESVETTANTPKPT